MKQTFGMRLQQALDERGLRQIDLANMLGFSKSRINQWIHDKYVPTAEGLYKAAQALNVSESWLMGNDVPMTYERNQLEMEYEIFDLFTKCYGRDAYDTVRLFLKLDDRDRGRILERIQALLEDEKYSVKKELSGA